MYKNAVASKNSSDDLLLTVYLLSTHVQLSSSNSKQFLKSKNAGRNVGRVVASSCGIDGDTNQIECP